MGDITVIQSLQFIAGATPQTEGEAICDKDFELNPPVEFTDDDYNESFGGRFSFAASDTDVPLSFGTVNSGKVLLVYPELEMHIKIVTADTPVPTETHKLLPNRWSVMHMDEMASLLVTNPSAIQELKGKFFVAGD